ncbi:MAG: glycosyltransferase family 9 protein [Bacteroidetes bacterium]|nr:glycosyltransferase family 9 protein [Bacteroidota bacterium]
MNPNTIRAIDYWFGQPICFFLTPLRNPFVSKEKPKKIIFLKFIEQGATVLAYPAMKRATELVGKENVYFCVFENNRPILDILNLIPSENIISISDKNIFFFLSSAFSALLKIRKAKIDTTIDMEFFSRASAIFSFMTGAKTRVGLHRFNSEQPYRGNLMTHRIQYNPYIHTSSFYLLLVEATQQNSEEVPMMKVSLSPLQRGTEGDSAVFTPSEKERKEMQLRLTPNPSPAGEGKAKIIILNPNASDLLPLRKWDKQNFIELGKKIILENPNACIIISGASSEQKDAEDICKQIGSSKAISFAGKTTLRELLTLYSLADILVTNDSGPGHFSALTSIRTLILFGPETPKLFGPISPNAQVIWKELSCSPCVNVFNHRFSPCNNNVCMQLISVEEVYREVKRYLN